ncbi:hypothetical protein CFP56_022634 [Quercus suber]|uniref:Uncharacterized protein n=1 Tax=Quercus suber TaxID=58331 RepID=A0AAW0M030_QUESU
MYLLSLEDLIALVASSNVYLIMDQIPKTEWLENVYLIMDQMVKNGLRLHSNSMASFFNLFDLFIF